MLRSIWWGLSPRPTDSEPWGSKSTSRTLRPYSANAAPRLIVVVVLPTPPFWLHIEMTRALPWMLIGRGSGSCGIGRPGVRELRDRAAGGAEDGLDGLSNRGFHQLVLRGGIGDVQLVVLAPGRW